MSVINASSPRPWWPWLATFAAFPPAGLLGKAVAGRIDSLPAATLGGLTAGVVLGTGQWFLLRRRGISSRWILGTAAGFAIGLAAGASAVSFHTDRPSLAVMGAVTGAGVGAAQILSLGRVRPVDVVWPLAAAALWALGWTVTSGVIDVTEQWPVFGSSGALIVVGLQSLFVQRLLPLAAAHSTRKVAF